MTKTSEAKQFEGVSCRLRPEQLAELDRLAALLGCSRGKAARVALLSGIDSLTRKKKGKTS